VLRGKPHQVGLSMTGAIAHRDDGIFCLQQHLVIFIHKDRAKRMVAVFSCSLGELNRGSQMLEVSIVHKNNPISMLLQNSEHLGH
jgi:hypothetical protein